MSLLLDLEALNNLDSILKHDDRNHYFFKQSEIPKGGSIALRILLPRTYSGFWFLQSQDHWMKLSGNDNKIKVVSPSMCGDTDLISDTIKEVKLRGTPQQRQLVSSSDFYDQNLGFMTHALILENIKYNAVGGISDYTVKNSKPCVFIFTTQILRQINDYFKHAQFNRASGKSIADIELGVTLTVSKSESGSGPKKKTDYRVIAIQTPHPVDAAYEDMCDDLLEGQKRQMYSDKYMGSIIQHFFNGVPTMAEPEYRFQELRDTNNAVISPILGVVVPNIVQPVGSPTTAVPPPISLPPAEPIVQDIPAAEIPSVIMPPIAAVPVVPTPVVAAAVVSETAPTLSLFESLQQSMK